MGKKNHSISKKEKTLLIGLNKSGEIIQFNKECQKITKYSRNDVIYKKILDFLIPESYVKQWTEMFDSAIKNKKIDDFEIPFKSSDGKEILVTLSRLSIEDEKSSDGRISFIGNIVKTTYNDEKTIDAPIKESDEKSEIIHDFVEYKEDKHKIDDFIFNNKDKEEIVNNNSEKEENVVISKEKKSKETPKFVTAFKKFSKKNKQSENEFLNIEKGDDNIVFNNEKYSQSHNMLFEEAADSNEIKSKFQFDNFPETDPNKINEYLKHNDIPDDIKSLIYSLDVREKKLNEFENRLLEDRKILDKRIAELSNWKEKLLVLELEIEKRRKDLVVQESAFLQNLASVSDNKTKIETNLQLNKEEIIIDEKPSQNISHDVFDQIQESAVIIQRGTIKKVNQSFAELLGYELEELINKRLFDFISPEGYPEIEKYYLDRLKGMKSSGYHIILMTKENAEKSATVSTKSTNFNGEKAEIAIFENIALKNDITSQNLKQDAENHLPEAGNNVTEETKKELENEEIKDQNQESQPETEQVESTDEVNEIDNQESSDIGQVEDNVEKPEVQETEKTAESEQIQENTEKIEEEPKEETSSTNDERKESSTEKDKDESDNEKIKVEES